MMNQPHNALTLEYSIPRLFGSFSIVFRPDPTTSEPNTYVVESTEPFGRWDYPKRVTLHESQEYQVPSPRLLAIHCAVGRILRMSGAGELISRLLEDLETSQVPADGTMDLGLMLQIKLAGQRHLISAD